VPNLLCPYKDGRKRTFCRHVFFETALRQVTQQDFPHCVFTFIPTDVLRCLLCCHFRRTFQKPVHLCMLTHQLLHQYLL